MMIGKTNASPKGGEALKLTIFNPSITWSSSGGKAATGFQLKLDVDSEFYPISTSAAFGKSPVPIVYENIGFNSIIGSEMNYYNISDRAVATNLLTGMGLNKLPDGTYRACLSIVSRASTTSNMAYVCISSQDAYFGVDNGTISFKTTGFSTIPVFAYSTNNIVGVMVTSLISMR